MHEETRRVSAKARAAAGTQEAEQRGKQLPGRTRCGTQDASVVPDAINSGSVASTAVG